MASEFFTSWASSHVGCWSSTIPARARFVLAGDTGQQIMRAAGERAEPLPAARELAPGLVHVRVRRNCRVAPRLLRAISGRLGRSLDHAGDRMPDHIPGSLDVVPVAEGRELPALLTALKAHLEQFGPEEVVVLSPFGEQSSLVGRFLAREPANKEERALRDLLSGERAVAWRSIFKGKGLDAAAVVLTDITPDAAAWADERRLSWNDLLYVGMTRAQYGCTVLRSEGAPWSGELDAELGAARVKAGRHGVRVVGGLMCCRRDGRDGKRTTLPRPNCRSRPRTFGCRQVNRESGPACPPRLRSRRR